MAKFKIYKIKDKTEKGHVVKTAKGMKGSMFGGRVDGMEDLQKQLDVTTDVLLNAYAAALFDESVKIMNKAQKIVPVDSRELKRSAKVVPPKTLKRPESTLSYNTPYALFQHEHHSGSEKNPGARAKYLERPMKESAVGMEKRIVRGIKKHAAKGTRVSSLKTKTYPKAR